MKRPLTPNPNLKLARAANRLAVHGGLGRVGADLLRQINRVLFSFDISVGAQMDQSCNFYRAGLGCVIHADAVVGPDCVVAGAPAKIIKRRERNRENID